MSTQSAIESAERLLGQGEPLLAYNAIQQGLESEPRDLRLRQLQGLTLVRSGDTERANRLLSQLLAEGMGDSETLGLLARTHKDLAFLAADAAQRDQHLKAALTLYHQAYVSAVEDGRSAAAYYTGINAAAMAVMRSDLATARRMASEVRDICQRLREPNAAAEYWLTATLGEAALILGEYREARACYGRASELARGRFGDLGSTRRQAQLLAERLPGDHSWISSVLRIPPVVMFAGPVIEELEQVRLAAQAQLERLRPMALYGSAACAADILYLEAMREFGGETHIVLPYRPEEFRRLNIERLGGDWTERFDRALAAASSITITSDHRARGSTASLDYANFVMSGIARLRTQVLGTDLVGLAISRRGRAAGSTSALSLWREQHVTLDEITLPEKPPDGSDLATQSAAIAADERVPEGFTHEIRAMLFADAVGYSKLNEDQIPIFVTNFLGAVAELNHATARPPEHVESTGDGLYMVFAGIRDAGHYAMQLNALVTGTNWSRLGLPEGMNIRIALHCGPVYCGRNPLTGARLYTGPHTSRTARIEPITPPGQVYASSAFAAVACALGVDELRMTYIGRVALAKGYGELALYHVRALSGRAQQPSVGAAPAQPLSDHAHHL